MENTQSLRRKRNRKRRRRRKIVKLCRLILVIIILVVCAKKGWKALNHVSVSSFSDTDYTVGVPEKRTESEVYQKLEEMAEEDKDIKKIYENKEEYPEELLSGLVNNPEMKDFVLGYLTADTKETGSFTSKECKEEYPLLLQWDKRWGYAPYGESIIALSGCGPTCLSMVILALTSEESATPYEIAKYSEENGYYVEGTGTSWSLMTDAVSQYYITADELSLSESVMKQELDLGHPIICAMGPGDFTTSGHYILIYGYNENGFRVNDPNCITRSEKTWTFEQISPQIKNLWSYQK